MKKKKKVEYHIIRFLILTRFYYVNVSWFGNQAQDTRLIGLLVW